MQTLLQDLRYSLRMLAKNPGFAAVAVLTLALGIGANSAIFSLINALLLRPLPVEKPQELVALYTSDYSGPLYGASSYPDYVDFRDRNDVFSGLVAYSVTPFSLSTGGESERVFGEVVSGNYFSVLGVHPALGRSFLPEEDRTPGAHAVAVVSHDLWQRRFSGDPALIGKTVHLNGYPFTIVGIAPAGFPGLFRGLVADLWVPLMMQAQALPGSHDLTERGNRSLFIMGRLKLGRLKPGATIEQAQARFQALAAQLRESYHDHWTNVRNEARAVTLVPESAARIFPEARTPVTIFMALLMTVVGLVLLIACANVANLMLARASARRKEIAIRLALGAKRGQLIQQLMTESLLLSLLGGMAGLLLAWWGLDLLMAFKPPVPVPIALDLGLDWRVLGFTFGVAVLTGILFGVAPAIAASRPDLVAALKDGSGATGAGPHKARLRQAFVIAQVTLSLVLLIGSGLFLRSLQNASSIDVGFDPNNVLVMSVDLRLQGYKEATGQAFYRQWLARAQSLSGVAAVSLTKELPLGLGGSRRGITIEGYAARTGEDLEVNTTSVGPGYFEAMRIPMLRGRSFAERDAEGAPGVVIINEAFARRYWPGQEPLGKRLQMGSRNNADAPYLEVVGVVKDGKYVTLGEEARPFFYLPLLQDYDSSATLIVRAAGNPLALLPALRAEVQTLDKNLPVYDVKTMTQHLALALLPARLAGAVLGVFGLVALGLAALGLYGVMSYTVTQRMREIGIRVALGAQARDVLKLVIKQGLSLTMIGVGIGLVVSLALTRLVSSLLFGLSATDPLTFALIVLLLTFVALLACYLPARRAMKVDPMVALRCE